MAKRIDSESREPLLHVAAVLAGGPLCVPGLLVGAAITKDLSISEGLLAAVVGSLVLTVYAGWTGALGARTGLATPALLEGAFGQQGSRIIAGVIGIALAGWYAVQTGFFGQTVHNLFPDGGVLTSVHGAALWGGLLMLTSALFGFRGIAKLSIAAVPLIIGLTLWALFKVGGSAAVWVPKTSVPGAFGTAVTMVIGSFAIGATINADITRFCRTTGDAWIATIVGFFAVTLYIFACGAITAAASGSGDLISAMLHLGLGAFAFVTLVLSQWTTNDNNIFYATTSFSAIFPKLPHKWLVLIFGGAATLAGALGIADSFTDFLLWLGVLIPPVGGVMLAHYARVSRPGVSSAARPISAFLGVILGAIAGKCLVWGVPAINSVVVAAMTYLVSAVASKGYGQAKASPGAGR